MFSLKRTLNNACTLYFKPLLVIGSTKRYLNKMLKNGLILKLPIQNNLIINK